MNWYHAHLRWAVMVEGAEGLRRWEEAVHIFPSGDHDQAFERALEIGRARQGGYEEGRRWVETRLAEVVTLECLGPNPTGFEVDLGVCRNENAAQRRINNMQGFVARELSVSY